jgi:hypothetical protein
MHEWKMLDRCSKMKGNVEGGKCTLFKDFSDIIFVAKNTVEMGAT